MSVLLITCELKTEGRNYEPFFTALKDGSTRWWHYLEATWIVETPKSPHEYANILYPHIRNADRLLIVKITSEHQGWLPKEAWDWLALRNY
jgi:hypothetical protein